jgi:two-component system nitrate/nitrite response regulator NarL
MEDTPRTSPHNVPEFEPKPGSGSAWAATREPSLLPPAGSSAARDVSHKIIQTTSPKSSSVMAGAENSRQKTVWVVLKRRLFRDGILSVLSAPDRDIIGNFESLADASQSQPVPDLIVLSASADENSDGIFSDLGRLRQALPGAKWLVLTGRTDPELLRRASAAGVDWLLPEDSPAEVLQLLTRLILLDPSPTPIQLVRGFVNRPDDRIEQKPPLAGSLPLRERAEADGSAAQSLIQRGAHAQTSVHELPYTRVSTDLAETHVSGNAANTRRQIEFSDREREVLGCLVSGLSNRHIAVELNVAEATVKVHVKGLLRKMQVSNRTQAAILALEHDSFRLKHSLPRESS